MLLVDRIIGCNDEAVIEQVAAEIADEAEAHYYSDEEARKTLSVLSGYNLLSLSYNAREQILYTISVILRVYNVSDSLVKERLAAIRDKVEDDLKEYIDEIVGCHRDRD